MMIYDVVNQRIQSGDTELETLYNNDPLFHTIIEIIRANGDDIDIIIESIMTACVLKNRALEQLEKQNKIMRKIK
jgi:hypothetical protein